VSYDPWGMLGERRKSQHCSSDGTAIIYETITAYDHTGATWWTCDCGHVTLEEGAYAKTQDSDTERSKEVE